MLTRTPYLLIWILSHAIYVSGLCAQGESAEESKFRSINGVEVRLIETHGGDEHVGKVAVAKDGSFLVVGDTIGNLNLYSIPLGKRVSKVKHGRSTPSNIEISPDGKMLAVSGGVSNVRLFSIDENFQLKAIASATTPRTTGIFSFSGDSKKLISSSAGKHSLYDIPSDKIVSLVDDGAFLKSHARQNHLTVKGGQAIVVTGRDTALIDFELDQVIQRMEISLGARFRLSHNGTKLAYADGHSIKIRNLVTGDETGNVIGSYCNAIDWVASDSKLVVIDNRRKLLILDANDLTNTTEISLSEATSSEGNRRFGSYTYLKTAAESNWIAVTRHHSNKILLLKIPSE